MQELNKKIIEWAKEREIDKKGTVEGQAIKTIEEMSELIKDSIGDVYVTLVIGCMLSGVDIEKAINFKVNDTVEMDSKMEMLWFISDNIRDIASEESINIYKKYVFINCLTLQRVAKYYHTNFKKCVELAYNEIANRKGKIIDGRFVKESDLNRG